MDVGPEPEVVFPTPAPVTTETGAIDPRLPDEPQRNGKMSTASSNSGGAKTKSSEEVSIASETSSKVEVSTVCRL